jgi:hypothetical protein
VVGREKYFADPVNALNREPAPTFIVLMMRSTWFGWDVENEDPTTMQHMRVL